MLPLFRACDILTKLLLLTLLLHLITASATSITTITNSTNEDFDYGPVLIILTRGRSGSVYISRVVEKLADAHHAILSDGILGQGPELMKETQKPLKIIKHYLQDLRLKYAHKKYDNLIGFKWKPFVWNDEFDSALSWCAKKGFLFLWNRRNPLDVWISLTKHHTPAIHVAHCNDETCVEDTQSLRVHLDPQETVEFIRNSTAEIVSLRNKLDAFKVKYLEVRYEQYVYGTDAARVAVLQKVAEFAVPEKYRRPARIDDFWTETLQTTSPHQNNTVLNYDEVAAAVTAHGFGHLLFP